MYESDNTTHTCDCVKAIPNSDPENAMMSANGDKPDGKKTDPELGVLQVNPLKMFDNMWPDSRLLLIHLRALPRDTHPYKPPSKQ